MTLQREAGGVRLALWRKRNPIIARAARTAQAMGRIKNKAFFSGLSRFCSVLLRGG
jgi:hypothetical protein